jgi:ribose transport system substrate-binding protein
MKKILPTLLLLSCINLFAANEYRIAALFWSMNIEGQVAMKKGLEAEVEKINAEAQKRNGKKIVLTKYVAGDGEAGMEKQIKQFEEAIKNKVDAIVVQPTDNAALAPMLKEANKAKIPVIAYDQYINSGRLESFVTSDNYQAGFLNGEFVAQELKSKNPLKIVIVEYPHVSSTVQRVDGFIDALEKYKVQYRLVKRYEAVEPVKGKAVGRQILADFPTIGSLDIIFTVNDGGGLAIVEELTKAKRTDIAIATVDGDPKSVDIIKKDGIIKIDSAQFCGPMGAVALRVAYDKLEGKKVGKEILIPVFPITKNTLKLYPGWLGPIPQKFKKPWSSETPTWNNGLKVR